MPLLCLRLCLLPLPRAQPPTFILTPFAALSQKKMLLSTCHSRCLALWGRLRSTGAEGGSRQVGLGIALAFLPHIDAMKCH
jgi:hypothetical protein